MSRDRKHDTVCLHISNTHIPSKSNIPLDEDKGRNRRYIMDILIVKTKRKSWVVVRPGYESQNEEPMCLRKGTSFPGRFKPRWDQREALLGDPQSIMRVQSEMAMMLLCFLAVDWGRAHASCFWLPRQEHHRESCFMKVLGLPVAKSKGWCLFSNRHTKKP